MADSKLTALSEISVPALEDLLYTVDDPSGTPLSVKVSATRFLGQMNHVCEGRLTLTSGTAITTSDVTAATSVYFTPLNGNKVAVYDGTRWRMYAFTELTLALGTLTSGKNYDVFLFDNSGTLTLESLVWTNDTTRATALVAQDGVLCKTGALTRRYLGTFRTTATTTTEDSGGGTTTQVGGKRFLWNYYNRQPRPLSVFDSTNSWVYGTHTIRQANAAAGNKVEYVSGDAGVMAEANLAAALVSRSNTTNDNSAGIGVDSTTAYSGIRGVAFNGAATDTGVNIMGSYRGFPGVGYHYLAWLECGSAGGTNTWIGDDGDNEQSGLTAVVWG